MNNIRWITIVISLILCEVISSEAKELQRVKRWKGSGDMTSGTGGGDMSNMFRGTAGVDYPNYKTIPTTNFKCSEQLYEGGLYADVDTQCQVYHVCHGGRKESFLCGQETVFNQQVLACDYWYSTECDLSPSYYYLNAEISNGTPWKEPKEGEAQPKPQTNNQRTSNQNNNGVGNDGQHNPGTGNDGQYNPGTSDDGLYNPGTSDDGLYNPGTGDLGLYNPGTGNDGLYNPDGDDRGKGNDGQYNPGTGNDGQHNPRTGNNGQYNPGTADDGQYQSGTENDEQNNSGLSDYQDNHEIRTDEQQNPGINNDEQYNPENGNDEQSNPETSNEDQYNTGTNDDGHQNPETSNEGIYNQNYDPNNGNRISENAEDEKSCCCLKKVLTVPWNFPLYI